jgi:head-tail adaptor
MGIGVARKVNIVVASYQQGADGIEPLAEQIGQVWAQINTISQTKTFDANKAAFKTSYEFIIRYDSALDITVRSMIEYNNRTYIIQSIDRVDRVRAADKFASQLQNNPEGKYWRIVATSRDIN